MSRFAFVVVVVVLSALGCARERSRLDTGKERADCRPARSAGSAGSADTAARCDVGLICLSELCVRPPPADCTVVAENLASMDLGNYAEPEQRAPVVAKYRASCEQVRVSKEEAACLDAARDTWSAGQCVPRMFPEMASTSTADCRQVADKVRATMTPQLQGQIDNPQVRQWIDATFQVMQQSCEQDAWPTGLKQCVLRSTGDGSTDAFTSCNQQMPPALQAKLQDRLQSAMQQQMR
ncbi:MAG: hypothetical protein H0T89_04700 [Deltaproteobacteria bacterium]|nr:hypothetical protein [Deltaproteobacteria bacterium]MDQ3298436.1 hypothetical protein [Myxococcota bacterium]